LAATLAEVLSAARLITPNSPALPALFETAQDEKAAIALLHEPDTAA
jgi:hypothetical protein